MKFRPNDKVYSIESGRITEHTISEIKELPSFCLIKIDGQWRDQRDYYKTHEDADYHLEQPCCVLS